MSKLKRVKNLSPWRKLALTFWSRPRDPSVYGWYDVDVTIAQANLAKVNQTSPVKLTLTHYFARAMGLLLAKYPMINGVIKWGTIYQRDTIDLLLQVANDTPSEFLGDQLSTAKIDNIDQKSLVTIAQELNREAQAIRSGNDPNYKKQFAIAKLVPPWLLKILVRLNEFSLYNLGLKPPFSGMKTTDPFGTAMLTSVGSLNCPPGLAPLVPPSRCPFLICIGRVENKPWVVENTPDQPELTIRPVMTFTVTFDHRFIDGLTASKMFKLFIEILYNPEKYL